MSVLRGLLWGLLGVVCLGKVIDIRSLDMEDRGRLLRHLFKYANSGDELDPEIQHNAVEGHRLRPLLNMKGHRLVNLPLVNWVEWAREPHQVFHGRRLNVDLTGDEFDTFFYNDANNDNPALPANLPAGDLAEVLVYRLFPQLRKLEPWEVDISSLSDLERAELLRELYRATPDSADAAPHFRQDPKVVDDDQDFNKKAIADLDLQQWVPEALMGHHDDFNGRRLDVDVSGDVFDPTGYDFSNTVGVSDGSKGAEIAYTLFPRLRPKSTPVEESPPKRKGFADRLKTQVEKSSPSRPGFADRLKGTVPSTQSTRRRRESFIMEDLPKKMPPRDSFQSLDSFSEENPDVTVPDPAGATKSRRRRESFIMEDNPKKMPPRDSFQSLDSFSEETPTVLKDKLPEPKVVRRRRERDSYKTPSFESLQSFSEEPVPKVENKVLGEVVAPPRLRRRRESFMDDGPVPRPSREAPPVPKSMEVLLGGGEEDKPTTPKVVRRRRERESGNLKPLPSVLPGIGESQS